MQMLDQNSVFMNLVKIFNVQNQNIKEFDEKINRHNLEDNIKITASINNLDREFNCDSLIKLRDKISSFSKNEINDANFLFNLFKEYKTTNFRD